MFVLHMYAIQSLQWIGMSHSDGFYAFKTISIWFGTAFLLFE